VDLPRYPERIGELTATGNIREMDGA